MIECIANISEGRDLTSLDAMAAAAGDALLDLHRDADHHRSVFTLAGTEAVRELATVAVERLDIGGHAGAHPRIGVVDVVPFVALGTTTDAEAIAARDSYARWSGFELGVPCFLYGPERTLPDIRRRAFHGLDPDHGAEAPHPSAGASAVGHRHMLVAYNLWLAEADLPTARQVAADLRSVHVRALGLAVGDSVQVSMNLIAPLEVGPAAVFDRVAARVEIERAELVGLVPQAVLDLAPPHRWGELDLAPDRTVEARCEMRGFRPKLA